MINQYVQSDIEYHLSSRNMKALFTGKTEHLRHFDPRIVKLEMDQGLKLFNNHTISPRFEIVQQSKHCAFAQSRKVADAT